MKNYKKYYLSKFGYNCCICSSKLIEREEFKNSVEREYLKCINCNILYYLYKNNSFGIIDDNLDEELDVKFSTVNDNSGYSPKFLLNNIIEETTLEYFLEKYIKYKQNMVFA